MQARRHATKMPLKCCDQATTQAHAADVIDFRCRYGLDPIHWRVMIDNSAVTETEEMMQFN